MWEAALSKLERFDVKIEEYIRWNLYPNKNFSLDAGAVASSMTAHSGIPILGCSCHYLDRKQRNRSRTVIDGTDELQKPSNL